MSPSTPAKQDRGADILLNTIAQVFLVVVVLLSLSLVIWLGQHVLASEIPFDTDEADHANAGLELYTGVIQADLPRIFGAIIRQAFYPPLHSFLVATSYLLFGPTLASSRLPSVVVFAIYLLAVFLLAFSMLRHQQEWHRWQPLVGATAALTFAATSVISVFCAVLCMLEPLGLLVVVLLLFSFHALDRSTKQRKRRIALCAVVATVLTLTKYSFGVIAIPAAICVVLGVFGSRRRMEQRLVETCCFSGVLTGLLVLWLLVTDHSSAWQFVVGHPGSAHLLSAENLLFYPRAWIRVYAVSGYAAYLIIAFAVIGTIRFWNHAPARLSFFMILWSFLILTVATTNAARHLIVVAPCMWLLAGLGLAYTIGPAHRAFRRSGALVCVFLVALFFPVARSCYGRIQTLPGEIERQYEGLPLYSRLQSFAVDNVDPSAPILVHGTFDQFSVEAICWRLAAESSGQLGYTDVRADAYPFTRWAFRRARVQKRSISRPWEDATLPKNPLIAVIEAGYYEYAIQIHDHQTQDRRQGTGREFSRVLEDYPQISRRIGDWEVTVYRLRDEESQGS